MYLGSNLVFLLAKQSKVGVTWKVARMVRKVFLESWHSHCLREWRLKKSAMMLSLVLSHTGERMVRFLETANLHSSQASVDSSGLSVNCHFMLA